MTRSNFGSRRILCALLAAAVGLAAGGVRGDIVPSGDVSPVDPATWNATTYVYIGNMSAGNVTVDNGSTLVSGHTFLGYNPPGTGVVAVNGTGSLWQVGGELVLGDVGTGTLMLDGGQVQVAANLRLGSDPGGSGNVVFGAGGGTITAQSLWGLPAEFSGSGVINTRGLVSDGELRFDNAHGPTQTMAWGGVTVNLDMSGATGTQGVLGVGNTDTGTLTIAQGFQLTSAGGLLGRMAGSKGTAIVDGTGSNWTLSAGNNRMTVGADGDGMLTLSNGAAASGGSLEIGWADSSTGRVVVDGATWNGSGGMSVGKYGKGSLAINHGGLVTMTGAAIMGMESKEPGTLEFDEGGGTLTARSFMGSAAQITGTGTINTNGLVSDSDIVIDREQGFSRTLHWTGDQRDVTVNLTAPPYGGMLGAGFLSSASLTIRGGVAINSEQGYLGVKAGSRGTGLVSGSGTVWSTGRVYVGYSGEGSLTVEKGARVTGGSESLIGYNRGSKGVLTVDGTGSTFTANSVRLGYQGVGMLNVLNGGRVQGNCQVGCMTGGGYPVIKALGEVNVKGSGSLLTGGSMTIGTQSCDGIVRVSEGGVMTYDQSIYVDRGDSYLGRLLVNGGTVNGNVLSHGVVAVANHGRVTGRLFEVGPRGVTSMMVGDGSYIDVSSGIFSNYGKLLLKAAPGSEAGQYTPMGWGAMMGNGTVEALGGTWDGQNRVFTSTGTATGTAGVQKVVDWTTTQRVVITDPTSGDRVEAAFLRGAPGTSVTLTARLLSAQETAAVEGALPAGNRLLEGWGITGQGYTAGSSVGLSIKVGTGYGVEDLGVWHWSGVAWVPYTASDLSYDGTYASFMVTELGGYAVTAVPEAGTVAVLAVGMVGVVGRRRRRGKD